MTKINWKHWVVLAIKIILTPVFLPFDIITWLGEQSDKYVREPASELANFLDNWERGTLRRE